MPSSEGVATAETVLAGLSRAYDFSAEGEFETGYGILNPKALMLRRSGGHDYPIWMIHIDGRPISIRVYKEEGAWLAEQPSLNICGAGLNPTEALEDAEMHIRHFIDYYKSISDDKLTGYALELKEIYSHVEIQEG